MLYSVNSFAAAGPWLAISSAVGYRFPLLRQKACASTCQCARVYSVFDFATGRSGIAADLRSVCGLRNSRTYSGQPTPIFVPSLHCSEPADGIADDIGDDGDHAHVIEAVLLAEQDPWNHDVGADL